MNGFFCLYLFKQNDYIMISSLQKIKIHVDQQIELTNIAIKAIEDLGFKAPKIMIDSNKSHNLILDELKKDYPDLNYIESIIDNINKQL